MNVNVGESIHRAYATSPSAPAVSPVGYATNNVYPSFPPMMQDGRSITSSWQPESIMNDNLIRENNITSNWQYRKHLMENSVSIIQRNFVEACNDTGYTLREYNPQPFGSPVLFKTIDSSNTMATAAATFGSPSDIKQLYLTREQLNSKKMTPSFNMNDF